jgi:hypothetical integral membrane protein (TIGR02206 family)
MPAELSPAFHAFGPSHLAAIIATGLVALVMIVVARQQWTRSQRALEILLACALIVPWPLSYWFYASTGTLTADNQYPCHLCDLSAALGVIVLLTRRRFYCELLYFWGLAGTIQGMITPALTLDFPSPRYIAFFVAHGGVVAAALYGVVGLRTYPRARAKWVAWGLINVYALVVGGFNALVGANYGFLCRKPATASLYDLLGPWPWYVVAASGMALLIFILLDLPFLRRRPGPDA